MNSSPPSQGTPNGRVGLGLLLVGLGKPSGFSQFGGTKDAFLGSLAPLLAFLFVLSGMIAWSGRPLVALSFFLTVLCDLLAPPVIADFFCGVWQRRDCWARYANVLNCAYWLIPAAVILMSPVVALILSAGISVQVASGAMLLVFSCYMMWFYWFAARHVLNLSPARALLVMLAVVFGTGLMLQVPVGLGRLAGERPVPVQEIGIAK
jgi:hypothetical protein